VGKYLLELVLLSLLVFAGLRSLTVKLLRCKLVPHDQCLSKCKWLGALKQAASLPTCDKPTFRLKSAFSRPDMITGFCRYGIWSEGLLKASCREFVDA